MSERFSTLSPNRPTRRNVFLDVPTDEDLAGPLFNPAVGGLAAPRPGATGEQFTPSELDAFSVLNLPFPEIQKTGQIAPTLPPTRDLVFRQDRLASARDIEFSQSGYLAPLPEGEGGFGVAVSELSKAVPRGLITAAGTIAKGAAALQFSAEASRQRLQELLPTGLIEDLKAIKPGDETAYEKALAAIEAVPAPSGQMAGAKQLAEEFAGQRLQGSLSDEALENRALRLSRPEESALFDTGTALQRFARATFQPRPDWQQNFAVKVAETLGSVIAFAVPALIPGAGGVTAGSAAGILASQGEALERAVDAGADPDEIMEAAMLAVIPGVSEFASVDILLRAPLIRQGLVGAIADVGLSAVTEGGQEAFQQIAQNLIQQGYDPDQEILEGVEDNAAVGAGTGATVATIKQAIMSAAGIRNKAPGERLTLDDLAKATPEGQQTVETTEEEGVAGLQEQAAPPVAETVEQVQQSEEAVSQDVQAGAVPTFTGQDIAERPNQTLGPFMFDATELQVDAERFQFKQDGDADGVTQRLQGVKKWDPSKAGQIIVFQDTDGTLFVGDGHQRTALARRLQRDTDDAIQIPGILFRAADGWTAEDVMAVAAAKNLAEGSGSVLDAAKILRERPDLLDDSMPLSDLKIRQAQSIARLDDVAYDLVRNDVVPANQAAIVGQVITNDPEMQTAAIKAIARFDPANEQQTQILVQRVLENELERRENAAQGTLFGEDLLSVDTTVDVEIRLIDRAIRALRQDRALFSRVLTGADRLEEAGSQIDTDTAAGIAEEADRAAFVLGRLATQAGPLRETVLDLARKVNDDRIRLSEATTALTRYIRSNADDLLSGRAEAPAGQDAGTAGSGQEEAFDFAARPGRSVPARPLAAQAEREKAASQTPADDAVRVLAEGRVSGDPDLEARTGAVFERKRPDTGLASQQGAEIVATSLTQVADQIISTLQIVARRGRFTLKGALGQYQRSTGVVRVQSINDVETLMHEAGHAIHDRQLAEIDDLITQHFPEIQRIAENWYPGDIKNRQMARREGFAEWFRVYLAQGAQATNTMAPNFTGAFETWAETNDPDLFEALGSVRRAYDDHITNTSAGAVKGLVVSSKADGLAGGAMRVMQNGLRQTVLDYAARAYTWVFDSSHPIRLAMNHLSDLYEANTGKRLDLRGLSDPYKMARLATDAYGAGHQDITYGVHGYRQTNPGSSSLRDALVTAHGFEPGLSGSWQPEIVEAFNEYLVTRRGLTEWTRFRNGAIQRRPTAVTEGDLRTRRQELEQQYPQFAQAASQVYDYANALWKKKLDAGLIDRKTYANGLKIADYVPFQRDMGEDGSYVGGSKTGQNKKNVVKRFRGSDRRIINPLESLMKDTYETAMIIQRNDTFRALAKLAKTAGPGSGEIIEKIPDSKLEAIKIGPDKLTAALRKLSNNAALSPTDRDAAIIAQQATEMMTEDATVSFWRAGDIVEGQDKIVYIWEDGKRKAYQLADGVFGKDLFEALTGIGRENSNWLIETLSLPAAALRSGITTAPDFLFANYVRDQVSAWVLTDVGFIPFVSGAKGIVEEVRQKDTARLYNLGMGIMGGANVSSLNNARIKRDIDALAKKGYIVQKGTSLRGLFEITELSETGTRLGVFEKAYRAHKREGLSDYEAVIEAAYMARDYIDFGRHGSKMLILRRMIPFFNAALQGMDKSARVLGSKGLRRAIAIRMKMANQLPLTPSEQKDAALAVKAWTKIASLAVFSLILQAMFFDDDDYNEASEYVRATHWVIPMGEGRIFLVPKPFELAVVANFAERSAEAIFQQDPTALPKFMRGLSQVLVPPLQSPTIQTFYELKANKNFFTGRDIVSPWDKGKPPELQYSEYASEFSKTLGQAIGVSPAQIDHVLVGFGASWGRYIQQVSNRLSPNRTEPGFDESPFFSRFIKDTARGSTSSRAFWEHVGQSNGKLSIAYQGYREYLATGNEIAAEQFLDRMNEDEKAFALLNQHFSAAEKRMHPLRRAADLYSVLGGVRKEMLSGDITNTQTEERFFVPRRQKRVIDDLLSRIQLYEQRNALVAVEAPGFARKQMRDARQYFEILQEMAPSVAAEIDRRVRKERIYRPEMVNPVWSDTKSRILADRENAIFADLTAGARAQSAAEALTSLP